ncbi:MAG: Bro-N domain-containing protein [Bacillota bacterium]|nr:Bro-N domain-containing protein [Bacillota bacterium]
MNALTTLNYNGRPVRTVNRDGFVWWILTDVCKILEISNSRDAASRLDDDEKDDVGITDTIGRTQTATAVNESGLYNLIFQSRKAEAKKFKKWVTSEVLPSIRKTGRYESKAPQKKSLRILDLRGLKVISNTDIANYFGVANATIASHAKAIGEYGILLEGAEMRRFKSENPNLPKSTSSMIVYSLSVAESICKRMGEEVTLRPTKVPTLPPPYPSTPSVTGDLDGALAAFNYIVREAQRLSNPDLRKAHLTVLMGVYVAISHMLKTV